MWTVNSIGSQVSTQRVVLSRLVFCFAIVAAAGACNSNDATKPDDSQIRPIVGLQVSAPSSLVASGQPRTSLGSSGDEESYAYISAPPGTTSGATAAIANRTRNRNARSAASVRATVVDGGFDPMRIPATAGDTLDIDFLSADGSILLSGAVVVPPVRPPTIVRTNPGPGKKDVPLNSRFVIVFSEPIDPNTITAQNIQVIAGATHVAGSLLQTDAFTVEFIPSESLRAMTSFQIVIGTGVRNLGGIGLESASAVQFQTAAAPEPPAIECAPTETCLAFTRGGSVYTTPVNDAGTAAGFSGATMLPLGFAAAEPVWSPDGQELAVVDWSRTRVCIVGRNGSGQRCAQVFTDHRPSWSPDGSELAFVGSLVADNPHQPIPRQLYALKTSNMSLRVILQDVGTFCGTSVSWAPDGSRIAFTSLPSMCGGLATVRPDGSDLRVVQQPNPARSVRSIEWSPDGKRFAVLAFDEIATLNVDGTGWQTLATASSVNSAEIMENPTWSSDGTAILFSAGWNCFMGCTNNQIMYVKRDGSPPSALLNNAGEPAVRRTTALHTSGILSISGAMAAQHQAITLGFAGKPVTDAIVSVNGVVIPHYTQGTYLADLPAPAATGETLDLKVVYADLTYEGTGEVLPTPVITAPASGATMSYADTVVLLWNSSADPDRFAVCENCYNNALEGAMYYTEGTSREFKIAGGLVDWGGGAIIAVNAYKETFLKPVGANVFLSNVRFVARSEDTRVFLK